MKQMNTNPRTGWLPASQVATPEITAELSRLSGENAALRRELDEAKARAREDKREERDSLFRTLRKNHASVSFYYVDAEEWSEFQDVDLYRVFHLLAPELLIEKSTRATANFLGLLLNQSDRKLRANWPVPSNSVKSWLADLVTLDLVAPSSKKHQVRDTNEYWTLTESGRELYKHIRRARLAAGVSTPGADGEKAGSGASAAKAEPKPAKEKSSGKAATRKSPKRA